MTLCYSVFITLPCGILTQRGLNKSYKKMEVLKPRNTIYILEKIVLEHECTYEEGS